MNTANFFTPSEAELELLRRLETGEPVPFPDDIKLDRTERLYENGFITVGIDGGLALSERGAELLEHHLLAA